MKSDEVKPIIKHKYKRRYRLSRQEKRRLNVEVTHFNQVIEPVVNEFIEIVMDENTVLSYNKIYIHYLDRIRKLCNIHNPRYKVIEVDEMFFAESFKPIEENNIKTRIFEFLRRIGG